MIDFLDGLEFGIFMMAPVPIREPNLLDRVGFKRSMGYSSPDKDVLDYFRRFEDKFDRKTVVVSLDRHRLLVIFSTVLNSAHVIRSVQF